MFSKGIWITDPVWGLTIYIGLIRLIMVYCVHYLKVGGPISRNTWSLFDDISFYIELKSTVKFLVYLQKDAPEGNLSASRQTKSGSIWHWESHPSLSNKFPSSHC